MTCHLIRAATWRCSNPMSSGPWTLTTTLVVVPLLVVFAGCVVWARWVDRDR